MEIRFADDDLDKLETDPRFAAGLPDAVVTSYRRAINYIRQAVDERDIRKRKSFHFEKLQGDREGQYSLRLNLQWRLVVQLEGKAPSKVIVMCAVENYHKG